MMESRKPVKDLLLERAGVVPKDPVGWLYVARAFYKMKDYHSVIESVSHTLRNEKTRKEGQHLLAFSLYMTEQTDAAASAFMKSISHGNESDWQPLVELLLDNESLKL